MFLFVKKEKKTMKDNLSIKKKINWYNIDKQGYPDIYLKNQAAIYIYMLESPIDKKKCYYIGSTKKIRKSFKFTQMMCY